MTPEYERLTRRMINEVPFDRGVSNNGNRSNHDVSWQDLAFNLNSAPCETDTAIIVTSWIGQLRWLNATLRSYRLSGKYVLLSYDNPFWPLDSNSLREECVWQYMPRPSHFALVHSVVFKHRTADADKRTGWFWDVRYAQSIIRGFPNIKYVYCTNGDCIWEKPKGIDNLNVLLGDGDVMSGQSAPGGTIHTADVLFKAESFHRILDYMYERMRIPVLGSLSAERLLRDAVDILGLKETFVAQQPIDSAGEIDYYCEQGLPSTFLDVVGFRNLYHEQQFRESHRLEPLPKEYFDNFNSWMYIPGSERETVCRYYDTGDRRYLYQWWDRGEDYWGNRLYYPIEHYSKSPIIW